MTKKDYKAIGKALRESVTTPEEMIQAEATAHMLAAVFKADNPRFNRERFMHYVLTGEDKNWGET